MIPHAKDSRLNGWLRPALWIPWQDHGGRLSRLHLATFVALLVPGIVIGVRWASGDYQPRPVNEVVHSTGLWAIRILFVSLAIAPLSQMFRWPGLIAVRRMVGVTAFLYVVAHLLLYALDEGLDLAKVATEIAVRYYLLVGFSALILLATLAWTSTSDAIRRLGGAHWRNVHRLVFPAAILAVAHHYMQSKVDVSEPVIMTGLLAWLLGYRVAAGMRQGRWRTSLAMHLAVAICAAILAALVEAAYYEVFTGIDGARVLEANLSPPWEGMRPAWVVLAILTPIALTAALRRGLAGRARTSRGNANPRRG